MNKKFNTSKILALTAAAGAATAISTTAVHADTATQALVSTGQTQQSPAEAKYQQAKQSAAANESAMESANTQAENQMSDENTQADKADSTATQTKVDDVTNDYDAAVTDENNTYNNSVNDADAAYQAAVSQAAANDQAQSADAAKRDAAVSAANSDYQAAVSSAQADKDAAVSAAADAQSSAVKTVHDNAAKQAQSANSAKQAKINDQKAKNQAAEQEAQAAVDAAKQGTATSAVNGAVGTADRNKLTNLGKRALDEHNQAKPTDTDYTRMIQYFGGIYGGVSTDYINDASATVSSENQLPMMFAPGIIAYDGSHDTSEKVNGNLSEAQIEKLNQLNVYWINQLRSYWKAHPELKYVNDDTNTATGESLANITMQTLSTTKAEQDIANQIAADREAANYGYNHTGTDSSKPSVKSIMDYQKPITDLMTNPSLPGMTSENMFMIEGSTMLQLEVSLYNHLQAMYWGEVENHNGTLTSGTGHLQAALNPDAFSAATAFQKTGDGQWIFLTEFVGGFRYGATDADVTATANKVQSSSSLLSDALVQQIKQAQASGAHTVDSDAVTKAEQHLADVKAAGQKALDKINAEDPMAEIKQAEQNAINDAAKTYQNAVNQANIAYDQAVAAAKTKRDQAINAANKQAVTPNTQAKLTQLKSDYDTKLTSLKTTHEQKLAQLKQNYDKQVTDLKSDLQAKIAARAQKLADFKKSNAQKLADLKAADQKLLDSLKPDADSSVINVPGRNTDTPSDKPADTPADKPSDTPSDKPSDTSADKPSDTPADKPSDMPADKPTDTSSDKPSDTPADKPTDTSSDTPSDKPADSAEAPAAETSNSANTPADSTETPTTKSDNGFQIILPAAKSTASVSSAATPVANQVAYPAVSTTDNQVNANELPQTGNHNSAMTIVAGMLTSIFAGLAAMGLSLKKH